MAHPHSHPYFHSTKIENGGLALILNDTPPHLTENGGKGNRRTDDDVEAEADGGANQDVVWNEYGQSRLAHSSTTTMISAMQKNREDHRGLASIPPRSAREPIVVGELMFLQEDYGEQDGQDGQGGQEDEEYQNDQGDGEDAQPSTALSKKVCGDDADFDPESWCLADMPDHL